MTKTVVLSIVYSALAAGLSVAASALPATYSALAVGAVGVLLLNLRNAWHLPGDAGQASK